MLVEQRKAILDDSEKKSLEEVREWLKKCGFDLNRSYTTLRGTTSTVFIQDVDPDHQKREEKNAVEAEVDRLKQTLDGLTSAQSDAMWNRIRLPERMMAIMHLIAVKIRADGENALTPAEGVMAQLFASITDEMERLKGGKP